MVLVINPPFVKKKSKGPPLTPANQKFSSSMAPPPPPIVKIYMYATDHSHKFILHEIMSLFKVKNPAKILMKKLK